MSESLVKELHIIFRNKNFESNTRKEFSSKIQDYKHFEKKLLKHIKKSFPKSELLFLDLNKIQIGSRKSKLNEYKIHIENTYYNYEEIYFNINHNNYSDLEFITKLAQNLNAKVYIINKLDEIIFLPFKSKQYEYISKKYQKSEIEYEEILLESLKFGELNEDHKFNFNIPEDIISETLFNSIMISGDNIIIRKPKHDDFYLDIIKLIKINGIKIFSNDNATTSQIFFSNVFEGLNYFGSKLIKIVINNSSGFHYYLGAISTGKDLKLLSKKISSDIKLIKNLLKSSFPGIDISSINKEELDIIVETIETQKYYGSIIGHTTNAVSNKILKEINNALDQENWGLMTIGESLNMDQISSIINDLKAEIESFSIRPKEENDEIDLVNLIEKIKAKKESAEYLYLSEVKKIIDYFKDNQNYGFWNTCNYIFTKKKNNYNTLYSILKSNYRCNKEFWFPIKIIKLNSLLSQFPKNFQLITVKRQFFNISREFKLFNTIYSSHKLGDHIHLPMKSVSNFLVTKVPTFQSSIPKFIIDRMENPIKLGTIKTTVNTKSNFYFDIETLMRHCLVMGSTGSGKTNTIMNLLLKIRDLKKNTHFLIIEPIKKEYRHLLNQFQDIEVYTTGSTINPLNINLFEVPSFMSYEQWVNELLDLFSTNFYIWYPFREIILNSLNDIYLINGWTQVQRGRTPTLKEFIKYTMLKIECSHYGLHNREGFMGAFENRFQSMIKGVRGLIYNANESRPRFENMLKKNIIIELDGLKDDEERSFVFSYIIKMLFLYMQQFKPSQELRHITIIEEAHRLIAAKPKSREPQDLSISLKAQDTFSNILSEIRTYGEGIIIAEQKPQQLNNVAITNTETKICHKLPSRFQIEDFKDSLGLSREHTPLVSRLHQGECIIKLEEIDDPFLVQIDLIKEKSWGIKDEITDEIILNKNKPQETLEQIHYKIIKNLETNESHLLITELLYHKNYQPRIFRYPKKQICLKFRNFKEIFWNRMKHLCTSYGYCKKCLKIKPASLTIKNLCSQCGNFLEEISDLKSNQLDITLDRQIIIRNQKIDELFSKMKKLVPNEYSSEYKNERARIKQEYDNILVLDKLVDLNESNR